jgi:hypothetical protein
MDKKEYYRQDGYQKGFEDAKRTGGKIKQEKIDKYLNTVTQSLSSKYSRAFIKGWHEGYNDGIEENILKSLKKDNFWKEHIYWENPTFQKGSN